MGDPITTPDEEIDTTAGAPGADQPETEIDTLETDAADESEVQDEDESEDAAEQA